MRFDHGADTAWLAVVTAEEGPVGFNHGVDAGEQLTLGDLAAELAPEHLDRVEQAEVAYRRMTEGWSRRGRKAHTGAEKEERL
jgi:hypothetical protein